MAALFALLIGLFVAGPVTDAFACGPEAADAAAESILADADHAEDDGCPPAHGCAHGHCHSPATLPPLGVQTPAVWSVALRLGEPPPVDPASAASDSLIRPPRA